MSVRACHALVSALTCALMAPYALAQWVDQTVQLLPGWNPVCLEVEPPEATADAVFVTDPPDAIQRVWSRVARRPGDANPCEDADCTPPSGWRVWLPASDPASALNTLRAIRGGKPYLIKAREAATLVIRGVPTSRRATWLPGYNVAGLFVDGTATFGAYLAPSPPLAQPAPTLYDLNAAGVLTPIGDPATELAAVGRAYWILSSAFTVYDGPLALSDASFDGLTYGRRRVEASLDFRNLLSQSVNLGLTVEPSLPSPNGGCVSGCTPVLPDGVGLIPLKFRDYANSTILYDRVLLNPGSPTTFALSSTSQSETARKIVRVSVERVGQAPAEVGSDGSGQQYQGILTITNGAGYRRRLPITAEVPGGGTSLSSGPTGPAPGLYVGAVTLDHVAWVQADARIYSGQVVQPDGTGDPDAYDDPDIFIGTSTDADPAGTTEPRPTTNPFSFPVIVHKDAGGVCTFLTEATLLFDPVGGANTNGAFVIATPDCTVCDSLQAGSIIDGERFKLRFATAAFAFDDDLQLSGNLGSALQGETVLSGTNGLNPFRHQYHPDHDGDQQGEVYAIRRSFGFSFDCSPPSGFAFGCNAMPNPLDQPGMGDSYLTGCYFETISGALGDAGLHKRDINMCGKFTLRRVADIATLNNGQTGGAQ